MARFKKKPVVVEAHQWWTNGDHPEDQCVMLHAQSGNAFLSEGKIVRYYRRPDDSGTRQCEHCGNVMHLHGWIDTLEGGHIACPGDWIITGVKGELYPCKADVFGMTYEAVTD